MAVYSQESAMVRGILGASHWANQEGYQENTRNKIYLSPVELGIIPRPKLCFKPFQTLTFENESCNS